MNRQDIIDEIERKRDKAKQLGFDTMINNYKKLSIKQKYDLKKVD